jgi:hypothetical protein
VIVNPDFTKNSWTHKNEIIWLLYNFYYYFIVIIMSSLLEIATSKMASMTIRNEFGNSSENIKDVSEKIPKELLVKIVNEIQKELVKTKKELIEVKELHCGSYTMKEHLQMVEEAHNYGFCKEKYEGRCHLCGDYHCILCYDPTNISLSCSHCYVRKSKEMIAEYKNKLETCGECTGLLCTNCIDCVSGQIMHLECSITEHKNGVCNCFGSQHALIYNF